MFFKDLLAKLILLEVRKVWKLRYLCKWDTLLPRGQSPGLPDSACLWLQASLCSGYQNWKKGVYVRYVLILLTGRT